MADVTVRELRNHGGEVLARVQRGEMLTVTKDGEPVAELRPLGRRPLSAAVLVEHWRHLPDIDGQALRDDIETLIDTSL